MVKVAFNAKLQTKILVNGAGMTLYMYASDYKNVSACTNDPTYHCSKIWPPLLTSGTPKAGSGAKASLLKSAKRQDGGTQVMYGGHLVYTWAGGYPGLPAGDKKPGDVRGQNITGQWWVLSPAGRPIKKQPKP